jgi:hypothetical protein
MIVIDYDTTGLFNIREKTKHCGLSQFMMGIPIHQRIQKNTKRKHTFQQISWQIF